MKFFQKVSARFGGARVFLVRRWYLTAAVLVACVCGIFAIFGSEEIVGAAAAKRELPVYCVQREDKAASLTFDAAWGNEDTQQLIDILARYDVKATFFVVGDWATKYPESVKALADAGHEIMNHSDKHKHMTQLTAEQIVADVTACNEKVAAVTGVAPVLFRAPYGEYDDKVVTTLRGMGMEVVQWDVEGWATGAREGISMVCGARMADLGRSISCTLLCQCANIFQHFAGMLSIRLNQFINVAEVDFSCEIRVIGNQSV